MTNVDFHCADLFHNLRWNSCLTIFASFIFGSGVVNLLDHKATGLQ